MTVSNPKVQFVSQVEGKEQALDKTLGERIVNQVMYTGLGTVAGAALGGLGTAFMGAKVASAGLGAAGHVVGGVAQGGIWGLLGVAATTIGLNTETGSQIVSTSTGVAKDIITWGPRLMIGGGAVAGGIGGHMLASSKNTSLIAATKSEILADNRAEIQSVEKARAHMNNQPRMIAAANAQAEQLGLMRPGSSPRTPRIMDAPAATMDA